MNHSKSISITFFVVLAFAKTCLGAEPAQTVATWDESCPIEKKDGTAQSFGVAVTAILIPKAAEAAVDAVGAAIKASADTSTVIRASQPVYSKFYKVTPLGEIVSNKKCLIIRKGIYSASDFSILDGARSLGAMKPNDQMYFELRLEQDPIDKKFLRFRPLYANIKEFEDSSFWTKSRRVDLQITLKSMYAEQNFGSITISFTDVTKGYELKVNDPRLTFLTSDSFAAPQLNDVSAIQAAQAKKGKDRVDAISYIDNGGVTNDFEYKKDVVSVYSVNGARDNLISYCKSLKASSADSLCSGWELQRPERDKLIKILSNAEKSDDLKVRRIRWAKEVCKGYVSKNGPRSCFGDDQKADYPQAGYISIVGSISHTREANKFGVALANVISNSAGDLGKAVGDQLPEARKKTADAAESAKRGRTQDIITSSAQLEISQNILDTALKNSASTSDDTMLQYRLDVLKAKIKVNNAYYAAGLTPPYSEYE
ncbi:hypothetical protein [Pseudomonas lini]|uniref:Uncharacterized protein n=1 Tax=Pseudomonas lini TaxID=163011 RepID=A0A0J6HIC8_9PSED|nr:hypothetical protein [Pseudomonas lini]KAB0498259.1 hypothetical protein F7R14_27355 [Pseudomonas lini]KMM93465.1 hypothetical protein TU81_11780 [Pseudomonas lini]SDT54999.1 hypothetical protein SAMN04490191_5119 [Pseudomonas lini]